ncbi:hypothetical protein K440DRAFT_613834 [Wilcoxina mikolae CBS 423.85]|nr:hypothetical protein K440DRAFT_613834 [Wilcoxina mikolae CBS 423.85]
MFRALHDPSTGDEVKFAPKEKVYVSGASGALTGLTLGLVLRGRSNAVAGAIVWGLLGIGGQYAYNVADQRHTQEVLGSSHMPEEKGASFTDRAFRSKWNPIKKLTDEEYGAMLNGKLLAIEAELAITNEEIEKLERQRSSEAEK